MSRTSAGSIVSPEEIDEADRLRLHRDFFGESQPRVRTFGEVVGEVSEPSEVRGAFPLDQRIKSLPDLDKLSKPTLEVVSAPLRRRGMAPG